MQVDDSKKGPILGKGGRTITEIQVSLVNEKSLQKRFRSDEFEDLTKAVQ